MPTARKTCGAGIYSSPIGSLQPLGFIAQVFWAIGISGVRPFFLKDQNRLDVSALIAGLQAGNQAAFRQLVEVYQSRVYNTVLSIVRQPEEAEDVAQEVFVQVFESIQTFGGDGKLTAWVYRIATTKALEAYRKRHARKRFAFFTSLFTGGDDDGFDDRLHPVDFVHPGIQLENKERATVLFAAIDRLPDQQKIAFTLHHIEGLSYQEITEVMQLSLSAVESLLHRAKANLRKRLTIYYRQDT